MENNRIVWQHKAPESNDIWVLPNGNLLFSTGKGVLEVTRQNDTVFHYASESPIFACQRLKNGNTFIGECNAGRLLEVSPEGNIVSDICILPEGISDGTFAFMRNARKLDNGHYLVAHYGDECVKEYDRAGKVVWQVKIPGGPHSVIRLPDGHTLVAVADKTQNPRIVELDKQGKTVWEISNKDIPGKPLKFLGGMQYFPDGRLLFTNWVGHVNPEQRNHLFLVDREKNILCTVENREGIQTMSSVFSLDENGKSYH
ncbi:aryl-sulfate sulfotransferase [Parabacteroides sp. AM58-2XD]|uniref:beta-propeller domain-containing protein n=2 Tax=Tannerellaceae TaxID=2005525 RepID=UPI001F40A358|nr:aryl-sulfate sulfotransferase [Parabacteroides sp. AM58-2XD]